ncbi:hypothetical protein E2C01_014943 [Portunus trituberculatus]|uniref:Uncharacterized protein n=1 Tax=Portunus trituberculatus TaxID=210409 RepID=A0A5B7DLI3_PORTR|nr:hypothetical protein [Portunus trituberculatus]
MLRYLAVSGWAEPGGVSQVAAASQCSQDLSARKRETAAVCTLTHTFTATGGMLIKPTCDCLRPFDLYEEAYCESLPRVIVRQGVAVWDEIGRSISHARLIFRINAPLIDWVKQDKRWQGQKCVGLLRQLRVRGREKREKCHSFPSQPVSGDLVPNHFRQRLLTSPQFRAYLPRPSDAL